VKYNPLLIPYLTGDDIKLCEEIISSRFTGKYRFAFFPHGLLEIGKTRKIPYQYITLLIHSQINIMIWLMILPIMLQNLLSASLLSKNNNIMISGTVILPVVLCCVKLGLSY